MTDIDYTNCEKFFRYNIDGTITFVFHNCGEHTIELTIPREQEVSLKDLVQLIDDRNDEIWKLECAIAMIGKAHHEEMEKLPPDAQKVYDMNCIHPWVRKVADPRDEEQAGRVA